MGAPRAGEGVAKMRGFKAMMGAGALAMLAAGGTASAAPVGSGTVEMEFLSFSGPVAGTFNQGAFSLQGLVNGQFPTLDGPTVSAGPMTGRTWTLGSLNLGFGVSAVDFGYTIFDPSSLSYNRIAFSSTGFSNVAVGQNFTLGTIDFRNGGWFGGGDTAAFNKPTIILFRISTFSDSGPEFNQQQLGAIVHTVNVIPGSADPNLLANQNAEADWVTIYQGSNFSGDGIGSFRVYDEFAAPPGFGNSGSFDLIGRFGSLNLVGLANPVGGFITASAAPLPFVPGGGAIPEPASWAMLIAGFGLVGALQRRRPALAA
jgi:hypothetical protein